MNLCFAYVDICGKMLDHVQCPVDLRMNQGCTDPNDYTTWQGVCQCDIGYDASSTRVAEDIMDAISRPRLPQLIVNNGNGTFDYCASY